MKKIKSVISVALIGAMMLSFAACASVKARDKKEVKEILKEELDLKKDKDYRANSNKDLDSFSGEYGKAYFSIVIYDDEDDAADYFEDIFDYYVDDLEDDCLDGKSKTKMGKTSGYILLNGEGADDGDMIIEDEYYYGGIYYADNMVIRVSAQKDKDSARDDVNAFCKAFGLPKP